MTTRTLSATILASALVVVLVAFQAQPRNAPAFEPCLYGIILTPDSIHIEWTTQPCFDGFDIREEQHLHSTTRHRDCMYIFRMPGVPVPTVDTLPWWCEEKPDGVEVQERKGVRW